MPVEIPGFKSSLHSQFQLPNVSPWVVAGGNWQGPCQHVGDLDWVPCSWLQPDLVRAVVGMWKVNQQLGTLISVFVYICVYACFSNENKQKRRSQKHL